MGCIFVCGKRSPNTPEGKVPRGIFRKAQHTHLTHTPAPTMSGLNSIYEKQFKRHKKDSIWGSLRPASISCDDTSSDNNGKGKWGREFPQPSFNFCATTPRTTINLTTTNSKQMTVAGRNTAVFFVFPPRAGVFFAKKEPPRG